MNPTDDTGETPAASGADADAAPLPHDAVPPADGATASPSPAPAAGPAAQSPPANGAVAEEFAAGADADDAPAATAPVITWALPAVPPRLTAYSLADRLEQLATGGGDAVALDERFVIGAMQRNGPLDRTFAAVDRSCQRAVTIVAMVGELTQARLDAFLNEPRMLAQLDHPGISPLYDLDLDADGRPYYILRKAAKTTLGSALRAAAAGQDAPLIATYTDRARVILAATRAIVHAHGLGIINLDIMPDHIGIERPGEATIEDWRSGRVAGETIPGEEIELSGTPAYMSPEQACGEKTSETSSVYSLGATLFHALTLRQVLPADDPITFWDRKQAGEIDAPTPLERARIPAPLLAIALKALSPRRSDRYAKVADMAADLEAWLADRPIIAAHDSPGATLARWYRHHAHLMWAAGALVVALAVSCVGWYAERARAIGDWSAPIVDDSFDTTLWQNHWHDVPRDTSEIGHGPAYRPEDGHLVTVGPTACYLAFDRRLYGATALEFDGEIEPGARPGDLSVAWAEGDGTVAETHDDKTPTYLLQVGAFDNSYACIVRRGASDRNLAVIDYHLDIGHWHHFRYEIDGHRMAVAVDGKTVVEYTDPFLFSSGHLMLYCFYPGKALNNLRLSQRSYPRLLSSLDVADLSYKRGEIADAIGAYTRIHESHPTTDEGQEALYKHGLCLFETGQARQAEYFWQQLSDPHWQAEAEFHHIDEEISAGLYRDGCAAMERLYNWHPFARQYLRQVWGRYINLAVNRSPASSLEPFLDLENKCFPNDPTMNGPQANLLYHLGEFDYIADHFTDSFTVGNALIAAGREDEVFARIKDSPVITTIALYRSGRFQDIIDKHPDQVWAVNLVQAEMGRFDEVTAKPSNTPAYMLAELAMGKAADLVAQPKGEVPDNILRRARWYLGEQDTLLGEYRPGIDDVGQYANLLFTVGREDEMLDLPAAQAGLVYQAHQAHLLSAAMSGDPKRIAEAQTALAAIKVDHGWGHHWFELYLMDPFIADPPGSHAGFLAAMGKLAEKHSLTQYQMPWNCAAFITKAITREQFLAQPCSFNAKNLQHICLGLQAETAGDAAAALGHYRDYLAMPMYERVSESLDNDPIIDRFVAWRVAVLGKNAAAAPVNPEAP
jgi:serine/threonine protein kinase